DSPLHSTFECFAAPGVQGCRRRLAPCCPTWLPRAFGGTARAPSYRTSGVSPPIHAAAKPHWHGPRPPGAGIRRRSDASTSTWRARDAALLLQRVKSSGERMLRGAKVGSEPLQEGPDEGRTTLVPDFDVGRLARDSESFRSPTESGTRL